jgi:hypothetical protein
MLDCKEKKDWGYHTQGIIEAHDFLCNPFGSKEKTSAAFVQNPLPLFWENKNFQIFVAAHLHHWSYD